LGGAVFKDGLNFKGKFWMKMKGDSCLVLRMTVWIKGILEFFGEVLDESERGFLPRAENDGVGGED
jgi:hypothetical protein